MNQYLQIVGASWPLVVSHVLLSIPPVVLGFALAIPIGWVANRYRIGRGALLAIVGILYAIPSLALLYVMPVLLGTKILDPINLVVVLTVYAVAVMVRSASDAFSSVPADVSLSATAVGFSGWRRFWSVELPLAGPVLIAGLRVVAVSTVSLVTVGALLGISSLGYLFLDGYQRSFVQEVIVGVVGTLLIAVVFDAVIVLLGRALLPWTRSVRVRRARPADVEVVSAA
jgi:ABC-type proline/glycine betaine transport systems, permease component